MPGRLAAAALAGAAMSAGQAPVSFPYLMILALPVLGLLWLGARNALQALAVGAAAGFAYFGLTMSWIVEPFLVRPDIHGWMALPALAATALGMAIFWAAPFWAAHRAFLSGPMALPALACVWSLSELVRSTAFTGFPWGLLAYSWSETAVIQLAAFAGPHGLGLLTLLVLFLPAMHRIPPIRRLAAASAAIALAFGIGTLRLSGDGAAGAPEFTVRVVQPNAAQRLKWLPEMTGVFFERQLGFTGAPANPAPDLVVWPETALPFVLGDDSEALARAGAAAGADARVIAGIRRREEGRPYNSLVFLDESGTVLDIYDKHHLVPFGEYIPLSGLFGRLGLTGMAGGGRSGFAAGPGPRIIRLPGVPGVLPLICYEAIFPAYAMVRGDRAEWLLHATNDAWFGEVSGPYQHLAQARVRAIEQGLPLVRAANTGISAVIDPYGRVLGSIPLGEAGFLDERLPAPLRPPPYAVLGEWPWLGAAMVLLFLARRRGTASGDRGGPQAERGSGSRRGNCG